MKRRIRMSKALIVQGGWQGHEPAQVAEVLGVGH
jgi:type 1 glutamine amidotransferase